MKRIRCFPRLIAPVLCAVLVVAAQALATDPQVSNVRAQQLADGTKRVEVLYDLSGAPAGGATVWITFSATGGAPYDILPQLSDLSGDVGGGIANGGNRRIVWDTPSTLPVGTFGMSFRAAVTAVDPGGAGDEITVYLPGNVPLVLVRIPAGTFMMGSPTDERGRASDEDFHQVTLTRSYYIGKYEVTQAQWQAVMGSNPAHSYGVGSDYPVYFVSWNEVCGGSIGSDCTSSSFIGRLNAYLGTTELRLPTEAEWERAARAGTQKAFYFDTSGNPSWEIGCGSFPEAEPYMWWCGDNDPYGSKPVASKLPNRYGLYDMHGNVWEWVADWYTSSLGTSPATDPTGPPSGSYRVFRGGGWSVYALLCRSASRFNCTASDRYNDLGFRLARSE